MDGSRENIQRHYDLSNDLFATFLDETMSYSSAWFADGNGDLADAQHRKIDGILDMAGVRAGQHILEIGTGWGGLAIQAAQRGARVTTLTISAEQAALAEQWLARAGVADRVQVLLRDYREAQGSYDAVVSVAMIEAVGVAYWPTYFGTLDRLLRPGGRVGTTGVHDRRPTSPATPTTSGAPAGSSRCHRANHRAHDKTRNRTAGSDMTALERISDERRRPGQRLRGKGRAGR